MSAMRKRLFGATDGGTGPNTMAKRLGFSGTGVSADVEEPLSLQLKRDWAKGLISSAKLQKYCMGAVVEHSTSSDTARLATVGAAGRCPQNAQRDIISRLGKPEGGTPFYPNGFRQTRRAPWKRREGKGNCPAPPTITFSAL